MSNVAKLKKQAAEFEQKRQFDKALAVYVKLLDAFDEYADELDVALFNRVGDLMLRQGNVADAIDYYEKAVDRYADTGFVNNAIALCNKILRHSPGRASVYYKLGKISAQKGFKNDAKVNFLEYADRMQKAGRVDEAFRALKEFADLCPDQDEIRLMLADQLTKLERTTEAVEQLQILYARYQSEGRGPEAQMVAERIREIDPAIEIRRDAASRATPKFSDLVFLDLDAPAPAPGPGSRASHEAPAPGDPAVDRAGERPAPSDRTDDRLADGRIDRIDADAPSDAPPPQPLAGLEQTQLADDDLARTTPTSSLLDLEPTSLDSSPPEAPRSTMRGETPGQTPPDGGAATDDLEFDMPAAPEPTRSTPPRGPLDGLPLMDFDIPATPVRSTPSTTRTPTSLADIASSDELELLDPFAPSSPSPSSSGTASVPGTPRAPKPPSATSSTVNDLDQLDLNDLGSGAPARPSTLVAMQAVEALRASVDDAPQNVTLRRDLAEAMLEAGDRARGIQELELAMSNAERAADLVLAASIAEELARIEPGAVKHHQKRVEYAFRTNDRPRLIEAYLSLGDALLRTEQSDKARTVFQRVIDLAPQEVRAQAALDALAVAIDAAPAAPSSAGDVPQQPNAAAPPPSSAKPAAPAPAAETFVNLGDWLRDSSGPKDTRMVVAEEEPTGDEDADFADMLRKFKQGVAENVDAEDYQSHYDLAIAFKEMGLLDEAIAEFQKALGSPANRLPTYEALGQCFLDKGQPKLAMSVLTRALNEPAAEEQLVGVLYWLGRAAAELGLATEALSYYQRVFVLDIQFRDIADRMTEVERAAR